MHFKVNLSINRGDRIGIIGKTGSGKSTLIDILIGLLYPSKGSVFVDNQKLDHVKNYQEIINWRTNIAHVPQSIYLSDSSIAQNIGFGIPKDEINYGLVKDAAQKAQIDDFINQLPKSYSTYVGERGVKLSGGQRQRTALGRALLVNAPIVVLDDALASVDNKTAARIIDKMRKRSNKTILMISHQLSVAATCDRVLVMDKGEIVQEGKHKDLVKENGLYKQLWQREIANNSIKN